MQYVKYYQKNIQQKIIRMGIKDVFGKSGNAEELIRCFEIDSLSIVKKIKEN